MRGRDSAGRAVLYLSRNAHKYEEARALLGQAVKLAFRPMSFVEPQLLSVRAVALHKARQAAVRIKGPFLVEDSGLYVAALRGFPGALSSPVFSLLGNEGLLTLLKGERDRRAVFRACVVYGEGGRPVRLFCGSVTGKIAQEPRGSGGFGFDPIFVPRGSASTFAEMPLELKNRLSHRARALRRFAAWFGARESL